MFFFPIHDPLRSSEHQSSVLCVLCACVCTCFLFFLFVASLTRAAGNNNLIHRFQRFNDFYFDEEERIFCGFACLRCCATTWARTHSLHPLFSLIIFDLFKRSRSRFFFFPMYPSSSTACLIFLSLSLSHSVGMLLLFYNFCRWSVCQSVGRSVHVYKLPLSIDCGRARALAWLMMTCYY